MFYIIGPSDYIKLFFDNGLNSKLKMSSDLADKRKEKLPFFSLNSLNPRLKSKYSILKAQASYFFQYGDICVPHIKNRIKHIDTTYSFLLK